MSLMAVVGCLPLLPRCIENALAATDLKLVFITTTYGVLNAANLPILASAMHSNPNLAFVIFSDGCCAKVTNLAPLTQIVSDGTGWGLVASSVIGAGIASQLTSQTLYRESFASTLSTMNGTAYSTIQNVPAGNVLYLPFGATDPSTSAYGLFVPHASMKGGAGACVFLVGDVSPMGPDADTDGTQAPKITAAFVHAALDPRGGCAMPAAGAPDISVQITGPGAPPFGVATAYQLQMRNQGPVATAATTVETVLPAGYTVVPSSLPAGCTAAVGNQSFTCSVPALAAADPGAGIAGGSDTRSFSVLVAEGAVPGSFEATTPVLASEVTTVNNKSSLAVKLAQEVTAVPALGVWALVLLAGLLPWFARGQGRRWG